MATDAFPAKAGPTKAMRSISRTGFSREEASVLTRRFAT
jgi:hypothetical protein